MSIESARDVVLTRKLLRDFGFFTRYYFKQSTGRKFIVAGHHERMFDALMRVASGEITRLIINIPPRAGKTEVAVKMFVAWCLANSDSAKFIHLSYSNDLVLDNSSDIRELVKSDEYQRLFPIQLKTDSDSKKKWYTQSGGGVYATAAGGPITGFGAGSMGRAYAGTGSPADGVGGCIIIDDPIKPDDAFSDTVRNHINRRFNNTIASRVNSEETPIVVIMQRLHESDMSGFLLEGGSGEKWEHLNIPVIDDQGKSIWPSKWPIARLREMEKVDPYTFAGQYLQRPAPLEGGLIKPDNIAVVEAVPAGLIERVRGWDFASSPEGDYTAGLQMGELKDGRYIILDVVRLRAGPDERDQALVNAASRDGTNCRISIPQDPGQAGATQAKYLVRKLSGYSVNASPETGKKWRRAEPVAAQINAGNVLMLRGEWNNELISEMRMFPNGTYDDQIDAMSRAFMELVGNERPTVYFPDPPQTGTKESIIHQAAPLASTDLVGDVCGRCQSFKDGLCVDRGFKVRAKDPACPMFIARSDQAVS